MSKIVHELHRHIDILSRPQATENSGQYLLLRTDILQKTVIGCTVHIKIKLTAYDVHTETMPARPR